MLGVRLPSYLLPTSYDQHIIAPAQSRLQRHLSSSEFHLFLFDIEALIVQLLSDELTASCEQQQQVEESQSAADSSAEHQKAVADAVKNQNPLVFRPPGINPFVSSALAPHLALASQKQARQAAAAANKGRVRPSPSAAAKVLDDQALVHPHAPPAAAAPTPAGAVPSRLYSLRKSASGFFYGGGGGGDKSDKTDAANNANAVAVANGGGGLVMTAVDEQCSQQTNECLSPCPTMNSLETARLIVSCLHAWGLDVGIDTLCVEKLGLRAPQPSSLCFASLSRERYLCLFLPGWATPCEQTRLLARQASNPRIPSPSPSPMQQVASPSPSRTRTPAPALTDTYSVAQQQQQRRELELARWQLSSSITTQHLMSITALANTMLSLSRLLFPRPDISHSVSVDSQLRHAIATATHLCEENPTGDLVSAVQQSALQRKRAGGGPNSPRHCSAPFTSYFSRDFTAEVDYSNYDEEHMEMQNTFRQVNYCILYMFISVVQFISLHITFQVIYHRVQSLRVQYFRNFEKRGNEQ